MAYSVYQHWDPLEVCIVGRSYSPEFYKFIKNSRVRSVMERIARETEEDYQKLITLLESFGVEILRPNVSDDHTAYLLPNGKLAPPPMTPRDYSIMLGEEFFFKTKSAIFESWDHIRGNNWPVSAPSTINEIKDLPEFVIKELINFDLISDAINPMFLSKIDVFAWGSIIQYIANHGNQIRQIGNIHLTSFNSAMSTRIGKDIYIGTENYNEDISDKITWLKENYTQYRWHGINTGGHSDGTFCPVKPGLIVSINDVPTYKDTFPDWEVIYLPMPNWDSTQLFLDLKEKNQGKWWVPGEELNDDFTNYVEEWLGHWVGYTEETVFDVNMLVIDEKNVVCNSYNKQVFDTFARHNITPHIINFRHRYFWDGGLHCITSDVSRKGSMQDYFPERKDN
jgi:hypothetical protein